MKNNYYVFSYYYETKINYRHGEMWIRCKIFPSKQKLKQQVIEKFNIKADEIIITGIIKMTENEFKLYNINGN